MDEQAAALEWPQQPSGFMASLQQEDADVKSRVAELQRGIKVEENFRWIFSHFYGSIFRFFAKRGISTDRCEDLTQEVFLRVYRGIGGFRGEAKFSTWLFRIAWNLWIKELSTTIRPESLDDMVEPDGTPSKEVESEAHSDQGDPLLDALTTERRVLLYRELQNMPPQMRRCILLRVGRELKYREIAALMQISIDAVKSHLNQAKTRLKARLQKCPVVEP